MSPGFLAPSLQESTLAGQPSVVSSPQQGAQLSLTSSLASTSSPSTTPEQGDKGEDLKLHPFNTPSLPPIPTRLLRVIQTGGYVNLSELLPEALAEAFDKPLKEGKEEPSRRQFTIEAPLDWAMAFATFAAATAHYHPERAPSLLIYFGIIMRLAREGRARTWLRYNRAFRQAVAINPSLHWDHREPDLWLAALSQEPQRPTNPPRSVGFSDILGATRGHPITLPSAIDLTSGSATEPPAGSLTSVSLVRAPVIRHWTAPSSNPGEISLAIKAKRTVRAASEPHTTTNQQVH